MKLMTVLSTVGNGMCDAVAAINNAQVESEMDQLDDAIKVLQDQRAELSKKLI